MAFGSANKENAWCGAFVHWILESVGAPTLDYGNNKYNLTRARAYKEYGQASSRPFFGSIAVKGSSHVGFVAGINKSETHVILLGGNQCKLGMSKATVVNYSAYPIGNFTAFRIPHETNTNIPVVIFEDTTGINFGGSTR